MRLVAADAGVDVAQVMQFFRSKDELFAAIMAIPGSALERLGTVFEGADAHLGERVIRTFIEAWEGVPEESQPLMAMLRGAIVNAQARDQLRSFIQSRLLAGSGTHNAADITLRAGLAMSMLVGVVTGRQIIGVPVLVEADVESLVAIVGPAIQAVLLPGPSLTVGPSRSSR